MKVRKECFRSADAARMIANQSAVMHVSQPPPCCRINFSRWPGMLWAYSLRTITCLLPALGTIGTIIFSARIAESIGVGLASLSDHSSGVSIRTALIRRWTSGSDPWIFNTVDSPDSYADSCVRAFDQCSVSLQLSSTPHQVSGLMDKVGRT